MSLTSRSKKQSIHQQKSGFKHLLSIIGIRKKIVFSYALGIIIVILGVLTGQILEFNYKYQIRGKIEQGQQEVDLLTNLTKKVLKIIIIQKDVSQKINNWKILEKKISLELSSCYEVNTIFKQLKLTLETGDKNISKNTDDVQLEEFIQTYFNHLKVYINQLENLVQEIKQIPPQTKEKVETASLESLSIIFSSEITIQLQSLSQDSEQLAILANQRVEKQKRDYQKVEKLGMYILICSLLLSAITTVIIAIYITNSIITPLKVITNVAEQVTEQANFELQLPVTTNDEIGELTGSLNELIRKVAEYTEQLQEAKLKAEAILVVCMQICQK